MAEYPHIPQPRPLSPQNTQSPFSLGHPGPSHSQNSPNLWEDDDQESEDPGDQTALAEAAGDQTVMGMDSPWMPSRSPHPPLSIHSPSPNMPPISAQSNTPPRSTYPNMPPPAPVASPRPPITPPRPPIAESRPPTAESRPLIAESRSTIAEPRLNIAESRSTIAEPRLNIAESRPLTPPPSSHTANPLHITNTPAISRNTTALPRINTTATGAMELVHQEEERYQTLKKLGEGGAGEVVLVKDNDIRRMVAMKRIKEDRRNASQIMRFLEEVQTVGQLEHPNIVPIHDVGIDDDNNYYFTMKFVQGETLSGVIEKLREGDPAYHKRFSFERRVQIFIEILQAIHFAHKHGYIHRDIKPENIMIGEYGEVQVMDWGIAKKIRHSPQFPTPQVSQGTQEMIDRIKHELGDAWGERVFQTQQGQLIGTPAYMSPEQAMGYELDERSDIYSLCVLLYEFVNLRHYLEHKNNLTELLMGIVMEPPIDSEQISNKHQGPTPREICFFLRKGMEKKPADRFQTVHEMIEEMQANLEGRICVYCPSTFLKRGAHEYGRYLDNHRVLGVVAFCLLLIVLGIGVFQSVRWIMTLFSPPLQ